MLQKQLHGEGKFLKLNFHKYRKSGDSMLGQKQLTDGTTTDRPYDARIHTYNRHTLGDYFGT
jgi:hypothetical protein